MEGLCSVKLFKSDGEALVEVLGAEYRVSMADFMKSGLENGTVCGEDTLLFLEEAAEKLRCIKKAFVYLSYSAQPSRKLRQKLKRAGFDERAVENSMALLEKKGYLNDGALCEEWARSFRKVKLFGRARIKKELYGKGFDRSDIDAAIEALEASDDVEDEASCAKKLLSEKFPSLSPDDRQGRAKAVSYLSGMGYSYDDINNAISAFERE